MREGSHRVAGEEDASRNSAGEPEVSLSVGVSKTRPDPTGFARRVEESSRTTSGSSVFKSQRSPSANSIG